MTLLDGIRNWISQRRRDGATERGEAGAVDERADNGNGASLPGVALEVQPSRSSDRPIGRRFG